MITLENGYELSNNIRYRYFKTAMDYLQEIINKFNFREGREKKKEVIPFMSIVKRPEGNMQQGYYYSQRDKIIKTIRDAKEETKKLYVGYNSLTPPEKELVKRQVAELKQDCVEEITKMSSVQSTMYLTLKELDNPATKDVSRFVFEILFGKPNESFFSMIRDSKEEIDTLVEDSEGDLEFYGFRFKKQKLMNTLENLDEVFDD